MILGLTLTVAAPGIAVSEELPPERTPQEIIRAVMTEEGIDPAIMLRIADAESDFIPTAKNPYSTATGLFQILIGTWNYFNCEGERTDALDNSRCAAKIAKDGLHHWDESRSVWQESEKTQPLRVYPDDTEAHQAESKEEPVPTVRSISWQSGVLFRLLLQQLDRDFV